MWGPRFEGYQSLWLVGSSIRKFKTPGAGVRNLGTRNRIFLQRISPPLSRHVRDTSDATSTSGT